MSGANHIVGGTVFTALFASFGNINIFKSPSLLLFTALFSILADCDHTKSPIGKVLYPLAKYFDRNFGHRTITHSLVFLLPLTVIIYVIEQILFSTKIYTIVCFTAYSSHLIFDMLTKQGVPLFYPFKRNPCVIPANPELRLKSSDLKTESFLMLIFLGCFFFCQGLFANGFWSTYNQNFKDLKHLSQEFRMSKNAVWVKFDLIKNHKNEIDSGYVISADEKLAVVMCKNKFFEFDNTCKINDLKYFTTTKTVKAKFTEFKNISADSLNKLMQNKLLANLGISSEKGIIYTDKENVKRNATSLAVDYVFNYQIQTDYDSVTMALQHQKQLLNYDLQRRIQERSKKIEINRNISSNINILNSKLHTLDYYNREKTLKQIQEFKTKYITDTIDYEAEKIKIQIFQKDIEIKAFGNLNRSITGTFKTFEIL